MQDELSARIASLGEASVVPTLALVRVGERPDDLAYERAAEKRCAALKIRTVGLALPEDCSQDELLEAIARVNADPSVHGCLMFRPLPAHLDEGAACEALLPEKDVDGITRASAFGVYANREVGFAPCTAEACVRLLDHYGVALEGAEVTVVGRSLVIGKPVSMLLQARDATVTMCHRKTRDLPQACRRADVVVVAAGHPDTIGAACVREGQAVVDVGINWSEELGRLVGDVTYDEVEPKVSAITPVPGGVGSVTVAVLAEHVVRAAERSVGKR
jgi:methylenetetrahydrofolate dehydrogenase (NADP+)/methenyltetrahydrofolate cyclohydrolase